MTELMRILDKMEENKCQNMNLQQWKRSGVQNGQPHQCSKIPKTNQNITAWICFRIRPVTGCMLDIGGVMY